MVLQDIVLGEDLTEMVAAIRHRPLHVVVLAPRRRWCRPATTSGGRRAARWRTSPATRAWRSWTHTCGRETPRIGLWLDTSDQTAAETVDEIMSRVWTEGLV